MKPSEIKRIRGKLKQQSFCDELNKISRSILPDASIITRKSLRSWETDNKVNKRTPPEWSRFIILQYKLLFITAKYLEIDDPIKNESKGCCDCNVINRYQNIKCTFCLRSTHHEVRNLMSKRAWIDCFEPKIKQCNSCSRFWNSLSGYDYNCDSCTRGHNPNAYQDNWKEGIKK